MMWAGSTVTLADHYITNEQASIRVYPINYTELIACHDPQYAAAFEREGLQLPYAGLGVSVLMETTDGFTPLTRRGIETPIYPGRLYSPGGGPHAGEGSTEALLQEILEETGLESGKHFDPAQLHMMAFVSDTHFAESAHSRPELVARLPLKLSYHQVENIQQKRAAVEKQTDVWGLEPFSLNTTHLRQALTFYRSQMCPPTEGGLSYLLFEYMKRTVGEDASFSEMVEFIEHLDSYERRTFQPPLFLK